MVLIVTVMEMVLSLLVYNINIFSGDMLYIPQYWWHHVTSDGSPNIAVNIWFEMFNYNKQFESAGLKESQHVVEVN